MVLTPSEIDAISGPHTLNALFGVFFGVHGVTGAGVLYRSLNGAGVALRHKPQVLRQPSGPYFLHWPFFLWNRHCALMPLRCRPLPLTRVSLHLLGPDFFGALVGTDVGGRVGQGLFSHLRTCNSQHHRPPQATILNMEPWNEYKRGGVEAACHARRLAEVDQEVSIANGAAGRGSRGSRGGRMGAGGQYPAMPWQTQREIGPDQNTADNSGRL